METLGNSFGRTEKSYGSGKNVWNKILHKYPVGGSLDITNINDGTLIPAGSMVKLALATHVITLVNAKTIADVTAYSASKASYAVGDIVKESNKIYKCKTAISAAEAFTASKWDEITVDELNSLSEDIQAVNGFLAHDIIVNKTNVTDAYFTGDVVYAGMIYSDRLDYKIPSKVLANLPQIVEYNEI